MLSLLKRKTALQHMYNSEKCDVLLLLRILLQVPKIQI